MREPFEPANERERLRRLDAYEVLDTMSEQGYDDIVRLAAHICDVPISLVSLVDEDRQWFKARYGLDATETPRSVSFCGHVVESGGVLEVPDSHADERFRDNPLVTGGPHVRYYCGAPLETSDGLVLGTLCVIDHKERHLTEAQHDMLRALARTVMSQLELRLVLKRGEVLEEGLDNARDEVVKMRWRHQRFLDVSLELLCVAGFDGFFKELNPSWTTALGWSSDELKAKPFIDFVHPDDRDATMAEAAVLATRERAAINFENRYRTSSGQYVWLRWTAAADPTQDLLICAARDITEQKQHEAELEAARDAAQRASRAKTTFLARMSHELRTPLNSVIGFTNLLLKNKRGEFSDKSLSYLSRVASNGTHLLGLINDVLDISRIEAEETALERTPVDLGRLLDVIRAEMDSIVTEANNELRVRVPTGVASLDADERRLKQVLINLIANANKFTTGGVVQVSVLAAGDGRPVRIDVADTGVGIPSEKLDVIFEAFRQVDEADSRVHGGTGLGLTIARSLCELHGFGLDATSEVGQGTTFFVRLAHDAPAGRHVCPAARERESIERWAARAQPRAQGLTVLVVDDDSDTRLLLAKAIEDVGAHVVTADCGERGYEIARAIAPALIVLDLDLPDVSGETILEWLRSDDTLCGIPTVIHSASPKSALPDIVAYLEKPLEVDEFRSVLMRQLPPQRRVLIVEDDVDTRTLLQDIVAGAGALPQTADNGRSGLALLGQRTFDLVVVDLCMPDMNGFELIEAMRALPAHAAVPIVVCTALELDADQRRRLRLATSALLHKSGHIEDQLTSLVREAM